MEKSCVTFLLCDPGWCVHKSDIQNKWDDNAQHIDTHTCSIKIRVNVTTGYTLVKTRHSRVPTYLQRETDTADWLTPTFTLPCPKNGGVYTLLCLLFSRTVPRFAGMYADLAGSGTLPSAVFSARITFRSQQRTPKPKSPAKQAMATGVACLGGRSAPTEEHQNISSSSSKHTMPLFYSVERTVATERVTKGHTNPTLPAWQLTLLV